MINTYAQLIVARTAHGLTDSLNNVIINAATNAIEDRGAFTIALSGGSAAKNLSSLHSAFESAGFDPHYDRWHVILADERCVPSDDDDSNLGALQQHLFQHLSIPKDQIHGINEDLLAKEARDVADDYETTVKHVLEKSDGKLDLAVLGFGPDGHTCSLFPNHPLLKEMSRLIGYIEDSPKPPPKRITLTLRVLNQMTRNVVFCGSGDSKTKVLKDVFNKMEEYKSSTGIENIKDTKAYTVTYNTPPPYPCAMIQSEDGSNEPSITWVVDDEAMNEQTLRVLMS